MSTSPSRRHRFASLTAAALAVAAASPVASGQSRVSAPQDSLVKNPAPVTSERSSAVVRYHTVEIDGLDVFYREAGNPENPTVLLLHGFPTSSHMFRGLIPQLAENYHVVAPDYPGYGHSSMPPNTEWDYTFDNLAGVVEDLIDRLGIDSYALYLMDYGAPVGFRMFENDPERVTAFIIQNGNAYVEGLDNAFWEPIKKYWNSGAQADRDALRVALTLETTKWQYTHGTRNPAAISPDTWDHVQPLLDRPGNQEIQLDLFYDYRTNVPKYPVWQRLFREHQPPAIIVWGKNDAIFPDDGAFPYLRDLADTEFHLFNTGHFALEEDGDRIAELINGFLDRRVK